MTLMVRTPDGHDLGSIELADGKLVPAGGAAAGLAKTALLKTGSAQAAYAWLNGYDNGYVLVGEPAVVEHTADPNSISGQLELAAIHGHHIPGTAYTTRHGWIPVIGEQLIDTHPQWMADRDKEAKKAEKDAKKHVDAADVTMTRQERERAQPEITVAKDRKLTPQQRLAVRVHHVYTAPGGEYAPPSQRGPAGPPRLAEISRARKAATISAQTMPGYAGGVPLPAAMPEVNPATDPALASLAGIGVSADAVSKYVSARVATEVARQLGEITAKQQDDMKAVLAEMHKNQQKTIALIRRGVNDQNSDQADDLRKHTVANTLFNFGGVAVAMGGLAFGVTPIVAALVAGIVPLVNVIHDYARNLG